MRGRNWLSKYSHCRVWEMLWKISWEHWVIVQVTLLTKRTLGLT